MMNDRNDQSDSVLSHAQEPDHGRVSGRDAWQAIADRKAGRS